MKQLDIFGGEIDFEKLPEPEEIVVNKSKKRNGNGKKTAVMLDLQKVLRWN